MKTGGLGGSWVDTERPKPAAVDDHYAYWLTAPPQQSDRCRWWVRQIERGWRPNRSWRMQGYDEASLLYGVYIWEYLNVIIPALGLRAWDKGER